MSTNIEWTHRKNEDGSITKGETWNPLIGCDKVSPGCKNCYAIKTAWIRMHNPAMKEKYGGTVEKTAGGQLNWTGKVSIHLPDLVKPLKTKKPTVYFVNSMSDLFHKDVPFTFIDQVFAVMALTPQHTYQILTKRADRMAEYFRSRQDVDQMEDAAMEIACEHATLLNKVERAKVGTQYEEFLTGEMLPHIKAAGWMWDTWTDGEGNSDADFIYEGAWPLKNVWLGVSVENQKAADERIPHLIQTPAAVRFLSCEPLLGPVDLGLYGTTPKEWGYGYRAYYQMVHWVIVGGESGPNARPMHPDWARSLRDQCASANVPFFFKQWGEYYTDHVNLMTNEPAFKMYNSYSHFDNKDWVKKGDKCISIDGRECFIGKDFMECAYPVAIMSKVGKNKAGRLLDGQLHDEYPITKQTAI